MSQASMPHIKWTGSLQVSGPSTPPTYDHVLTGTSSADYTVGYCEIPSEIAAGDLMILVIGGYAQGGHGGTLPTLEIGTPGWNLLGSNASAGTNQGAMWVYWKFADEYDTFGVNFQTSSAMNFGAHCIIASGVASASPISDFSFAAQDNSSTTTCPSITATDNSLVLAIAHASYITSATNLTITGVTEIAEVTPLEFGNEQLCLTSGWKAYGTGEGGSTGTFAVSGVGAGSTEDWITCTLCIDGGFRSSFATPADTDSDFSSVKLLWAANYGGTETEYVGTHTVTLNGTRYGTYFGVSNGAGRRGNGSTADYFSIADHADFDFGSGDFTVECYAYPFATNQTSGLVSKYLATTGNRQWALLLNAGAITAYASDDGAAAQIALTAGSDLVNGRWNHCVFERAGNTFRIYMNGTVMGTDSSSITGALNTNSGIDTWIGRYAGFAWDNQVYIDEVRITKGVARYNGAFSDRGFVRFPRSG